MEVRKGYKQTEVGTIPEDWNVYFLGEIGKFKNGINKGSEAFGQGTPFVNLMDVFGVNSIGSTENLGLITCTNFEQSTYNLRRGDVIFIRSSVKPSGVGLTAVVENDLPATVYSGFLIRFRDGGTLDIGYKRFCFYEERFRNSIIGSSTVSANTNINQESLKRLCIPLPPTLAEQEAIAEALSDADALIEAIEQLIAKKRQIKQGAMQELLTGKRRLPGFSGEWENKKLGKLCEIVTGKKNVNEGDPDGDFPFFTCSRSITFSNSYSFDTEAILIAGNGDVGTLHYYKGKFEAYQRTYVLDKFQVDVQYLNQYFKYFLIPTLLLGKIGSSIPYILLGNLLEFNVSMPKNEEEARLISTILIDMDAEITALEEKLVKARQVKAGMMSELLTGKIRLV